MRVETGCEVDVARGVHDEVAVRVVEGPTEHEHAEHVGLVGDDLSRNGADPDDRDVVVRARTRDGVEEPEMQPVTDLDAAARGGAAVHDGLVGRVGIR